jgi:hypothetical protein
LANAFVLALVIAVGAACGSSGSNTSPGPGGAAVPAVYEGPQGQSGQFVVKCGFSHALMDDPIVHPGDPGASHLHDFFGNQDTDAYSTPASLAGGDTTCNVRLDSASYWAPALMDHHQPVTPLGLIAYYRPAPGVDPASLQPYPEGLEMVAGDQTARTPQPVQTVGWMCGNAEDVRTTPGECPSASPLRLRVTFPDCWDGQHLDSADHKSHVTYSQDGACPSGFPVAMPQLTALVVYPISGGGHDLELASGGLLTGHADFVNAWDQQALTDQVTLCLHRAVICSVASNKAEDQPIVGASPGRQPADPDRGSTAGMPHPMPGM